MMVSASILPILIVIYQERLTIQEEAKVLNRLEEETQRYMTNSSKSVFINNDISVTTEEVRQGLMRFCSTWIGANGREYEYCLLAHR